MLLPFLLSFWPIAVSQAVVHATGSVLAAYVWGPIVLFFLMAAMALTSLISVLIVPARAINHEQVRGFSEGRIVVDNQPSGLKILLICRPLFGQKLALQDKNLGTSLMSACIVAAQVIMVPTAMLVVRKAATWGRKPLLLAGFLILPIRSVLYTLSDNPYWLVGVQMFDGIGAGLYGALFPLIVADLMEGTGRFNVAQGVVTTAQGIGASLSTTLEGIVVVKAGYSAAFLMLAAIAGAGLFLLWAMMPETKGFIPDATSGEVSHEVKTVSGRTR